VYQRKPATAVSWYRPHLDTSLQLLDAAGMEAHSRVIDVGGGASTLVDDLLDRGLTQITVLDLSAEALAVAQARLGARAAQVTWLTADLLDVDLPAAAYDFWHDRAVLHFLADPAAAARYAAQARHAVRPGGAAIIGGFAPNGPLRCSDLEVARRSAQEIATLMGPAFALEDSREELHQTPAGSAQAFVWVRLRRQDREAAGA